MIILLCLDSIYAKLMLKKKKKKNHISYSVGAKFGNTINLV